MMLHVEYKGVSIAMACNNFLTQDDLCFIRILVDKLFRPASPQLSDLHNSVKRSRLLISAMFDISLLTIDEVFNAVYIDREKIVELHLFLLLFVCLVL